jgi:hypothetical protein
MSSGRAGDPNNIMMVHACTGRPPAGHQLRVNWWCTCASSTSSRLAPAPQLAEEAHHQRALLLIRLIRSRGPRPQAGLRTSGQRPAAQPTPDERKKTSRGPRRGRAGITGGRRGPRMSESVRCLAFRRQSVGSIGTGGVAEGGHSCHVRGMPAGECRCTDGIMHPRGAHAGCGPPSPMHARHL